MKNRRRVMRPQAIILLVIIAIVVMSGIFILYKSKHTSINIIGDKIETLEVNSNYEELGANLVYKGKPVDNKLVVVGIVDNTTIGTYIIEYKYSGFLFKKEAKRTVNVVDTQAPVISLKKKDFSIILNEKYVEPGFSAIDNYDGDLTSNVSVQGVVDVSKEGVYQLVYSVEDTSKNVVSVTRNVKVVKKVEQNTSNSGSAGVIFLTFDDGPHSENTDRILSILKSEGVKATFFVTGVGEDAVIKRTYDQGHELALHTYSHVYEKLYANEAAYYSDLYKIQDRVKRITGFTSMLIRFPGGTSNSISRNFNVGIMTRLTKDVERKGFKYFDWNVDSGDANYTVSGSYVYNNTIKQLSKKRSNVVLMHDIHNHTADALRDIIQYGKNNGYTFDVLSQLEGNVHHKPTN